MTGPGRADAPATLERLAEELDDRREFTTVMIVSAGQRPRLAVEYHPSGYAGDVYADDWFWLVPEESEEPAEPLAPINDPARAASQVEAVLSGCPYERPNPPHRSDEGTQP